jgi:hypothetical protein
MRYLGKDYGVEMQTNAEIAAVKKALPGSVRKSIHAEAQCGKAEQKSAKEAKSERNENEILRRTSG